MSRNHHEHYAKWIIFEILGILTITGWTQNSKQTSIKNSDFIWFSHLYLLDHLPFSSMMIMIHQRFFHQKILPANDFPMEKRRNVQRGSPGSPWGPLGHPRPWSAPSASSNLGPGKTPTTSPRAQSGSGSSWGEMTFYRAYNDVCYKKQYIYIYK